MKTKIKLITIIVTLTFATGLGANAQDTLPDLSMRAALYFTGAKTNSIDLAKDKYVAQGGTMELKKSQATSCDGSGCIFNIGFIAFRAGNTRGELSTYGLFSVENSVSVGNTVFFGFPDKTKQGVHSLKLKMGANKVTFSIDPYQKTAETDENNNTMWANFNVTDSTPPPIRKVKPIKD